MMDDIQIKQSNKISYNNMNMSNFAEKMRLARENPSKKPKKELSPYLKFKKSQGRKPRGMDRGEWNKEIRRRWKDEKNKIFIPEKFSEKIVNKVVEEKKKAKRDKKEKEEKQLEELNKAIAKKEKKPKKLPQIPYEKEQLRDLNIAIVKAKKKPLPKPPVPKKTKAVQTHAKTLLELQKMYQKKPTPIFPAKQITTSVMRPKPQPNMRMRNPIAGPASIFIQDKYPHF